MPNITLNYYHEGEIHLIEFTHFMFNNTEYHQVISSTLDLIPERTRYALKTVYPERMKFPLVSLEVDPRIQSLEARIVYFDIYAAILRLKTVRPAPGITCHIKSVEDYL